MPIALAAVFRMAGQFGPDGPLITASSRLKAANSADASSAVMAPRATLFSSVAISSRVACSMVRPAVHFDATRCLRNDEVFALQPRAAGRVIDRIPSICKEHSNVHDEFALRHHPLN